MNKWKQKTVATALAAKSLVCDSTLEKQWDEGIVFDSRSYQFFNP